MSTTLVLEIVTADGMAMWPDLDRVEYQATPPSSFGDWQPGVLPIRIGHTGAPVGFIDYLEAGCGYGNGLHAVGVVDHLRADELDGIVMCSPELRANARYAVERQSYRVDKRVRSYGHVDASHAILDGVGLVMRTAGVTATKVIAFDGDYRDSLDRGRMSRPPEIIGRAAKAATWELRYRRPAALRIHRPAAPAEERGGSSGEILHSAPIGWVLGVR